MKNDALIEQAFTDWKSNRLAWKQRWPDSPGRWIFVNTERCGKRYRTVPSRYSPCPYDRVLKAVFPSVSAFVEAAKLNTVPQSHVADFLVRFAASDSKKRRAERQLGEVNL